MTLTLSSAPGVAERANSSALECLVIVGAMQGLQLTVLQLVQDNALESAGIDYAQLVHCARHAGLKAKALHLDGDGLAYLENALPAIVRLKSGASMVLVSMNAHYEENPRGVTLRDPNAAADALLTLDWLQFQEAWSGDVALVRREYHVLDEEKPFGMGLIGTLILRERKLVRDIALSAFALSIFALAPIIFWMTISSRVLYYKSMSTFAVLCIGMGVIIAFETAFTYLRGFLLLFLAARVDTKLSEYIFDRVIQLPVDYFERVQLGETMHDFNEVWKIREFLTGQVFGVVLNSLVLFIFLPVMFAINPLLTLIVLLFCALIVVWLLVILPHIRKANGAVIRAETMRGSFLYQTLAGIRTVKSLALESRQRKLWDAHVARCAEARNDLSWMSAVARSGVVPFERLAVTGAYAVGVYIAMSSTSGGVMVGTLFAFLMLSQRVAGPLMQLANLITNADEARAAVEIVRRAGQSPERGRPWGARRQEAASGPGRVQQGPVFLSRQPDAGDRRPQYRGPGRNDARRGRAKRIGQDHSDAPAAAPALGI